MAKFLFVYRRGIDASNKMSPEEMQKHMEKWRAWIGEGLQKGWITDAGDGLTAEGRVVKAKVVTDGPYAESKEVVGGFSIIEVDTIQIAAEIAKGCPNIPLGGSVEIRPLAGFSMQKQ